jgi:hypothetical protein
VWVLDNRDTPHFFNFRETRRPVVHSAGQHNTDDARAVRLSRGAKQRIGRGAKTVLTRTPVQLHTPLPHQQVMVWRSDIDAPMFD